MSKVAKQTFAFRGNIRQSIIRAINGLQQILTYQNSLTPGSGLPLVFTNADVSGPVDYVLGALTGSMTGKYPPAQKPA